MSVPLAAVLGLAMLATPAATKYWDVQLEIDADGLGSIDEHYDVESAENLVHEDVVEFLAAERIVLHQGDDSARLQISLFWKNADDGVIGISVEVDDPDRGLRTLPLFYCDGCLHVDVGKRIEQEMPAVLDLLAREESGDTGTLPHGPANTGPANGTGKPTPKAIGPLGYAGIAIGVGGLATAIAGGVYLGRGDQVSGNSGSALDRVEHNPRLGRPLLGAGIGGFVVGAIMVAVDAGRRAKQRKPKKGAQVGINVRPGYTGVSFGGRF